MRHTMERDGREHAASELATAYATSFGGSPTTTTLLTSRACPRRVYCTNSAGNTSCATPRARSNVTPASARSSTYVRGDVGGQFPATNPRLSLESRNRHRNDIDAWMENSGFAPEFRRRRGDVTQRRRAMMGLTRAIGPRGAGGMDYEALEGENQQLKQALHRAAEENRRYRVNSARLEEELLRSDGKVEALLVELEQAPGTR